MFDGDEWKTTFWTLWELFEYVVMPFGLAKTAACFQCFIQSILSELLGVFYSVYIHEILFFSKTDEKHTRRIEQALQRLQDYGLVASPQKCCLYQ